MPVPSSYTEKSLAEFMHVTLGKTARALDLHFGPSDAGDYAEAVNEALLAYGETTIASITTTAGIQKLRALARVAAWRFVLDNWASLFDFSADGASYSRSQLFKHAQEALQVAELAALSYSSNYAAQIVAVEHLHDPYRVLTEDELAE